MKALRLSSGSISCRGARASASSTAHNRLVSAAITTTATTSRTTASKISSWAKLRRSAHKQESTQRGGLHKWELMLQFEGPSSASSSSSSGSNIGTPQQGNDTTAGQRIRSCEQMFALLSYNQPALEDYSWHYLSRP